VLASGAAIVLVAAALFARHIATSRRQETEREIASYVDAAAKHIASARANAAEAKDLRRNAFARFDAMDRDRGEELWRSTRTRVPQIDRDYDDAGRELEAAFMLDQGRGDLRRRLAEIRYEQLLFASEFRLDAKTQVLEERLRAVDVDGGKLEALKAPGMVILRTTPPAQTVTLERYDRDPVNGRRVPKMMPGSYLSGPIVLPQGAYRFTVRGPGLADVYFPFEVQRGEHLTIDLALPQAGAVPAGFAYVPPGSFWFGDGDEQLRSQFLGTVPVHRRSTGAYAIARHETTYAEWITFLDALPEGERSRYAPNVSAATRGSLRLRETGGTWELAFQPTSRRYTAAAGEPVTYVGRRTLAQQDWRQFPVSGISPQDAERYVAWLRSSGRIPRARLCTELEWERAARGADERIFPSGDEIGPDEANFDQTYGRVDSAYGPDVVGSHQASRSPFGVDDLMGNVFELTVSVLNRDEFVIRGGGYYFAAINGRSTNREPVSSAFRDPIVGIRLCASPEGENDAAIK
jgi:formylglycine-generating enzyme required for sulfatase activity